MEEKIDILDKDVTYLYDQIKTDPRVLKAIKSRDAMGLAIFIGERYIHNDDQLFNVLLKIEGSYTTD